MDSIVKAKNHVRKKLIVGGALTLLSIGSLVAAQRVNENTTIKLVYAGLAGSCTGSGVLGLAAAEYKELIRLEDERKRAAEWMQS